MLCKANQIKEMHHMTKKIKFNWKMWTDNTRQGFTGECASISITKNGISAWASIKVFNGEYTEFNINGHWETIEGSLMEETKARAEKMVLNTFAQAEKADIKCWRETTRVIGNALDITRMTVSIASDSNYEVYRMVTGKSRQIYIQHRNKTVIEFVIAGTNNREHDIQKCEQAIIKHYQSKW
jgi:hypothetical protein